MVKGGNWPPERGDLVWLDLSPVSGHEQSGRRPALVISPRSYNHKSGLMLCCPVTTRVKGYPFEVGLEGVEGLQGVILADQIKSLDWKARRAEKVGRASGKIVDEVLGLVGLLVGKNDNA